MPLPNPSEINPLILPNGSRDAATVFLSAVIDHPNIEIGAFTYYNDSRFPEDYASSIAPYLFAGAPEKLQIGKFCQIAQGAQFITSTANHPMDGISTYPFAIFDPPRFASYRSNLPVGSNTVIGNDCWFGREATVLPGATIGNGVIIGAKSVVAGNIPDYAVVVGNPGRVIRMRFSDDIIAKLLDLAWWDWNEVHISAAIDAIENNNVDALEQAHQSRGVA